MLFGGQMTAPHPELGANLVLFGQAVTASQSDAVVPDTQSLDRESSIVEECDPLAASDNPASPTQPACETTFI